MRALEGASARASPHSNFEPKQILKVTSASPTTIEVLLQPYCTDPVLPLALYLIPTGSDI